MDVLAGRQLEGVGAGAPVHGQHHDGRHPGVRGEQGVLDDGGRDGGHDHAGVAVDQPAADQQHVQVVGVQGEVAAEGAVGGPAVHRRDVGEAVGARPEVGERAAAQIGGVLAPAHLPVDLVVGADHEGGDERAVGLE